MILNVRKMLWLFLCGILMSANEARGQDKTKKGSDSNDKQSYTIRLQTIPIQRIEYGVSTVYETKPTKEKPVTRKKENNKKNRAESVRQAGKYEPPSALETGSKDRNEVEQKSSQTDEQKTKTESKRKLWKWF